MGEMRMGSMSRSKIAEEDEWLFAIIKEFVSLEERWMGRE